MKDHNQDVEDYNTEVKDYNTEVDNENTNYYPVKGLKNYTIFSIIADVIFIVLLLLHIFEVI